jgi:hypothetical protein
VNVRSVAALVVLIATVGPALAAPTPAPTPMFPKRFTCFDAPGFANYDAKHDRFYVHYAAERIRMDRVPGSPVRYLNRKKNVEWRIENGKADFVLLLAGSEEVDRHIATCVYKRK